MRVVFIESVHPVDLTIQCELMRSGKRFNELVHRLQTVAVTVELGEETARHRSHDASNRGKSDSGLLLWQ